jgi:hypothetical protein
MIFAELATSGGLVHDLFAVLIISICCAIIWWLGRWFIEKMALPGLVLTVWTGLFLLVGAIVLINFLLGLTGHGFLHYW